MINKKKYLNNKKTTSDFINFDKALFFNNIYRKNSERLQTKFLPQGWHWIFFSDNLLSSHLATDGHSKRGSFLPKLNGYKRMFAGSTLKFNQNFQYSTLVKKNSQVTDITSFKVEKKLALHFVEDTHARLVEEKINGEEPSKLKIGNK